MMSEPNARLDPEKELEASAGKTAPPTAEATSYAPEEVLHMFEAAGTAVFGGLTKAQREIAKFVAERIRQDLESQTELMRCRSLDDVLDVQSRFLNTAMDQYSAEATRLAQIGAEMIELARPTH